MTEAFYSFDVAIISIIALIIGTAIGRLLSRPQKGDTGPQGPQGNIGERGLPGEPGKCEPHTHHIHEIDGLTEALEVHDSDEEDQ